MIDDPDVVELLVSVLDRLRTDLGAAACSLALLEGDDLVFVAASGAGADEVVGLRIPVGRGIAGWAVVSGETVAVADVTADQRWDRETAERTGYVPRSILATPVDDGEATTGVLEVLDRTAGADDGSRAFGTAAAAARQLALAVRLGRTGRRVDDASAAGLSPAWRARLDRLAGATVGEQRLAGRLLDALIDPDA